MTRPVCACAISVLTLLMLASAVGVADNMAPNGNCEDIADGKPVGWGVYDSVAEWGSLDQGHKGKGAYFVPAPFSPIGAGPRKGEDYRSAALVLGSPDGYNGADAMVPEVPRTARYSRRPPPVSYKVSFWVRSEASELKVFIQPWRTEQAGGKDRHGKPLVVKVPRTEQWAHYERTVALPAGTKRFALMFQQFGYKQDGLELGRVEVDEVSIEPGVGGVLSADDLKLIEIPEDPAVYIGDKALEEVLAAHRAGDEAAIKQVEGILATADKLAAGSDEWYRQFFRGFEPRGQFTIACPIHPFKTRYYNDFEWSLDEPWKVICKHCKAEGRKYYYYPNPDYPDDGNGCEPTDEVWRRDHDEAWSKAHRGIPWDHWDGTTHGDFGGGRCYHFLGKYYVNSTNALLRRVPHLALAYHCATKLFAEDSDQYKQADLYAHKAKLILLSYSRAVFGDDYLAAAEGISPQQFQARIEEFYRPTEGDKWTYEKLPGFRYFSPMDACVGDPRWADVVERDPYRYDVFNSVWDGRAAKAGTLLEGFTRLRTAFTDKDDALRRICERLIVHIPGDREKVAMGQDPPTHWLKRGLFEQDIHPYNLETGGDNLAVSTQRPRLIAGLFLRDDKIIENVALDLSYYFRNYFNGDGLGGEGSPTYSLAGYHVTSIFDRTRGLKGDFDEDAPYFDKQLGGLNMAAMESYKSCATKLLYYTTPDNRYIPWEDSCYEQHRGTHSTSHYVRMEQDGGGIPERERKYLNIARTDDGKVSVSVNRSVPLPAMLLHDRRKAILRMGRAETPAVVSLNFTKACGHLHYASQDLMIHACGQELASDLGYLGSDHFLRMWIKSCPAHNCLTLRTADGNPAGTVKVRGDLRRHFIVTPFCQVADSAEYDAADWAAFPNGDTGELSRQVLLMSPSEDHQYVVDIARGRGGDIHDYYFHCHGLGFETAGIKLAEVADPQETLYDYSGFTFGCRDLYDAKVVRGLAAAKSSGPWQATWSRIDDYRGQPKGKPLIHDDVFMRLWMLDEGGSEIIAGDGAAQRYIYNNDFDRTMKIVCVRRPNTALIDNFVSVMEPYQESPFINNVRRISLNTNNQYSVALAIETIHGTDYVITYGGPADPPEVTIKDGGHTISTDADIAVVSFPDESPANMLLAGGTYLTADEHTLKLEGPPQLNGSLVDFDDAADTLTIQSTDPFPEGGVLAGQPIVTQHREDRSTYAIGSVQKLAADRYLIRLDDQPHLMNNWLLVRKVTAEGIIVEPPPTLDSKRRTYKVYAGKPGNTRLLGPLRGIKRQPIHNEYGRQMHSCHKVITDDYTGVEEGGEIAISRLEKGHDTVFVTRFAHATGDEG